MTLAPREGGEPQNRLLHAYAVLVDALRIPCKKSALKAAVQFAAREVRAAIVESGGDPDAPWIESGPVSASFPALLHISTERDTSNDEWFFLAHEDGVVGLGDGEPVAVYRRESTGRVKVTTELIIEESP